MRENTDIRIPGRAAVAVLTTLLSAAIAFNAWAVTAVYARPTTEDVRQLIIDTSPYIKDRALIIMTLQDIKAEQLKLQAKIDDNSKIVHQIRAMLEVDK